MNKNLLLKVLGFAGVIAVIVIAVKVLHPATAPEATPTVSATVSPSPTGSYVPKITHYGNPFMTVDVPRDWTITEATNSAVAGQHAVSITKGHWVLYINPAAAQASGVEGGRFDEYAAGAPGVESIMGDLERPRGGTECGKIVPVLGSATIMGTSVARHDFVTTTGGNKLCHLPSYGISNWFLAVIGKQAGLNAVSSVTSKTVLPAPNDFPVRQFAITMTYSATKPDLLPRAGSQELLDALAEMDAIVSTIAFR